MCAIFGWIKFHNPLTGVEIHSARRSLEAMAHRGPDFQGEWSDDLIYMGHRRLSIIDLSPAANQPFKDKNGRFVLTFNGEIYNYLELRQELQKEGFEFQTQSDTEVLLAGFGFWGKEVILKLDGMFSVAIQDNFTKKHYLFRDHLGQKPLYYYEYTDGIVYASELRGLLELDCFHWKLDTDNFLKFLANSCYMRDTTPLRGVKKLLPGWCMEISDGKIKLGEFWNSIPGDNTINISFEEAVGEFKKIFNLSCKISMRSDVPYGVFLSGGIDSSLILDACQQTNPEISSFSLCVSERGFDERKKAVTIANCLGVSRNHLYQMDQNSVKNSLEDFLNFSDEPHGDPGFVNSYYLAKSARRDITVAISGDGADELFAGYVTFLALKSERVFRDLSEHRISKLEKMAQYCLPRNDGYLSMQFRALAFLQGFPANNTTRFPLWLSAVSPEDLQKLCPWKDRAFFNYTKDEDNLFSDFQKVLLKVKDRSRVQMLLYFYQKFFLPEFVCMHTDRAAMQNSLEVRSPFLSPALIEFANRLPDHFKIKSGELKRILRHFAYQRRFPRSIYAQKKQGFTFPVGRWLKTVLRDKLEETASSEKRSNGLIDPSFLRRLKDQHLSGRRNNYRILFNIMVFQKWLKKYAHVSIET